MRRFEDPAPGDMLAMTRQLRNEGDLAARRLAGQIEKPIRASQSAVSSSQSYRRRPVGTGHQY
jgi:hypothetical protein